MHNFIFLPSRCKKLVGWIFWAEVDTGLFNRIAVSPQPLIHAGKINVKLDTRSGIAFQAPVPVFNQVWEDDYQVLGITNPPLSRIQGGGFSQAGKQILPTPFAPGIGERLLPIYYEDTLMSRIRAGMTTRIHFTLYYTTL